MSNRESGVLMHISSLPGNYGIGSFGKSAYDFVNHLFAIIFSSLKFVIDYANDFLTEYSIPLSWNVCKYFYQKIFSLLKNADLKRFS